MKKENKKLIGYGSKEEVLRLISSLAERYKGWTIDELLELYEKEELVLC